MGLFDFLQHRDINEEVARCRAMPGAVLLDVRAPEEYAQGHIPGSVNLPLAAVAEAKHRFADRTTPLFVYCLSGGRSRTAVAALEQMGFTNVVDMGGISAYRGAVER